MKKQFLILVTTGLTYSCNLFAQDKLGGILPLQDGRVIYIGIVQVDSVSKDEVYKRAKHWFIDTYKSAKDVIQLDDKENGELIGKGYFKTSWGTTPINVWQSIKIQIKDGRYKYEITDFNVNYYVSGTQLQKSQTIDMTVEAWDKSFNGRNKKRSEIYEDVNSKVISLVGSLKKFVETHQNDDW